MDTDFDTFRTAVYTQIDTLLQTQLVLPAHPGPPPRMSDSEVLTLVVIGQWRGSSERALLRWVESDLHTFFYGCSLLLAVTPSGVITGLVIGPGGTQDRWLFDALVGWRADPTTPLWAVPDLARNDPRNRSRHLKRTGVTGPRWWPDSVGHAQSGIYLTDNGFSGPVWHAHWRADDQAEVIASRDATMASLAHHRRRQVVETVNAALLDVFHLAFPCAKTMWGVVCRIARKCLAFNVGIWANRLFGRADLALATLVNC